MKFGKRLKAQIEQSLPEWRDKFLSYKELKQRVKALSVDNAPTTAEAEFGNLLYAEMEKFNAFFLEQEEEFVIRQKELKDRIKNVTAATTARSDAEHAVEIAGIRKDIVNFHGEMVLLLNYSSINYTGLAKILKKYDKRTGALMRFPFIENVLKQPFFTTELISRFVKDCETMMEAVFPSSGAALAPAERKASRDDLAVSDDSIFRNTVSALLIMQEVRKGSSTYGQFSLPPLSLPDSDWLQSFQQPSPIPIEL